MQSSIGNSEWFMKDGSSWVTPLRQGIIDLQTAAQVKIPVNAFKKFFSLMLKDTNITWETESPNIGLEFQSEGQDQSTFIKILRFIWIGEEVATLKCHWAQDPAGWRCAFTQQWIIYRQISELLEQGMIKQSSLPCMWPMVLVPTKDDVGKRAWQLYPEEDHH